jgi:peptidase M20/M25/M40-like protein
MHYLTTRGHERKGLLINKEANMKILQDVDQDLEIHIKLLKDLVALPTVSSDPDHDRDMDLAAAWLRKRCQEAGLDSEVRHPPQGHPIVVAHSGVRKQVPHLFFYGHYDVLPTSSNHFQPVATVETLQGAGAGGQKGRLAAHLCAFRALHLLAGYLPVNVTLLLEGEKEIGSPRLTEYLTTIDRERPPFDLLILISDLSDKLEGQAEPGLPPEPYEILSSEPEKVLLETVELLTGLKGRVIEPLHTLLRAKTIPPWLRGSEESSDRIERKVFARWVKEVMHNLYRLGGVFQAHMAAT